MTSLILPPGVDPPRAGPSQDELYAAFSMGINASLANPAQWLKDYFGGGKGSSGVAINYTSSLSYAYVFSAVSLISGDVACLPLNVYALDADGNKTVDPRDPAQWLLNEEPNELMDALTFREILQSHALLWGNGYAAIDRSGGRPARLIPLLPDRTRACISSTGALIYESYETYTQFQARTNPIELLPSDVLHIKGLGFDGLNGHSVITLARNSWGLGIAAETHGGASFKNGGRPSVTLETEAKLDKETATALLDRWENRHSGPDNQNRPALLTHGLKVHPFSMSNEDTQWLESRKFQRVEVAAWFRMPPHKIGDDSRLSYNSIEAENRAYLNQCLKQWLSKWESECRRKLLPERVRMARSRTIAHDTQDLVSADIETKNDVVLRQREAMIITQNEARRALGYSNVEDGDSFENPNTSTGNAAPPPAPEPPTPEPPAPAENRVAAKWLAHTMGRMIQIETKAAHAAAKKPGFGEWLAKYYADDGLYRSKVVDAIEPVIGVLGDECRFTASGIADAHLQSSREVLLGVVASCGPREQLAQHVTEAVAAWPARAEAWASELVETSTDV